MKDSDKTAEGQSFYSEALTGSGTIKPDGTYGEPEPDPTVQRGGPAGARTTSGGVERPAPAPLQRQVEEASETKPASTKRSSGSK